MQTTWWNINLRHSCCIWWKSSIHHCLVLLVAYCLDCVPNRNILITSNQCFIMVSDGFMMCTDEPVWSSRRVCISYDLLPKLNSSFICHPLQAASCSSFSFFVVTANSKKSFLDLIIHTSHMDHMADKFSAAPALHFCSLFDQNFISFKKCNWHIIIIVHHHGHSSVWDHSCFMLADGLMCKTNVIWATWQFSCSTSLPGYKQCMHHTTYVSQKLTTPPRSIIALNWM
jgi:hypothetical protein